MLRGVSMASVTPRTSPSRRWPAVVLAGQLVAAAILLIRELGGLQPAELAVHDRLVASRAGNQSGAACG